jgi:hypothetical protein
VHLAALTPTTRVALAFAALWGVALLVGATTLPAYDGGTGTSSPDGTLHETHTTATLVEANGRGVLVTMAVPLVITLVVAALLLYRRRQQVAVAIATVLVALLAVATVLAMLSVGAFVLPVVAALVVALVAEHRRDALAAHPEVPDH